MTKLCAVRRAALLAFLTASPLVAQEDIILKKSETGARAKPDHWTRYSPPTADEIPADMKVYIIQPGDTLWDIAARELGNPYYWPQIWEVNRYITDPHWIYPNDPLVIPRPMAIADLEPTDVLPDLDALPPPRPVAKRSDLYCAPYIVPREQPSTEGRMEPSFSDAKKYVEAGGAPSTAIQAAPQIVESEDPKVALANEDVVYINRGEAHGVAAGDEFLVVHPKGIVSHPRTGKALGALMQMVGTLKVLCTQQQTSTAMVTSACDSLAVTDLIRPLEPLPIPLASEFKPSERRCGVAVDRPQGNIVYAKDTKVGLAEEDLVNIDLGSEKGLVPGDFLMVYRQNRLGGGFPPEILGDMVVLLVEADTSMGKIISSYADMNVGDTVQLR